MNKLKLIPFLLLVLFIGSCTTLQPRNPAASLVPGNAIFYAQVGNTRQLFNNLDQFLAGTDLSQVVGGVGIEDLINLSIAMAEINFSLDWFNLEKPAGFAMLPSEKGMEELENFMMILPLNTEGEEDYYGFIEESFKDEEDAFVKQVDDYILIYSKPWIGEMVPPEQSLDSTHLDKYDPGSVAVYMDIDNVLAASGMSWDEIADKMKSSIAKENTGSEQNTEMVTSMLDMYMDFFREIRTLSVGLALNETGMVVNTDTFFTKKGKIHEFGKKIKSKTKTKAMLKYLPVNAMFSYITGIEYSYLTELMEKIYSDILLPAGMEQSLIDEMMAEMNALYKTMGPGSATAYDFNFDIQSLSALDNPELLYSNPEILDKAFTFDFISVSDLRNRQKLRDFYAGNRYTEFINKMMKTMLSETADMEIDLGFKMNLEADLDNNGFKYDRLSFEIDLRQLINEIPDQNEQTLAMMLMKMILEKFTIFMHFSNDKYYLVMGYNGVETLRQIAENDGLNYNQGSLASSPTLGQVLPLIPENSDMISQFSVIKFYNLIAGIPNTKLPPLFIEDAPGIIGYVDIIQNRWQSATFWGITEIKQIIQLLLPIISGGENPNFLI